MSGFDESNYDQKGPEIKSGMRAVFKDEATGGGLPGEFERSQALAGEELIVKEVDVASMSTHVTFKDAKGIHNSIFFDFSEPES